ncbi:uncharacterized protein TNCV_4233741 [Trichonephila clavipes]|nr:uncharacterized protein TNCV_4233741 [Trichonephila clavipes]
MSFDSNDFTVLTPIDSIKGHASLSHFAQQKTKKKKVKQKTLIHKVEECHYTYSIVGDRLKNTFKKDFFLCSDNEHIFGGNQGDTPEIMDGILTTARDVELEVNEDDIEELIMGHEDKLTIEELQEILKETKKHSEMCLLLNKRKTKENQCRHLSLKIF